MKLAIISDIHGNFHALKKALEIIDKKKISEVICLGDLVDYGANPNECILHVEAKCRISLLGNHDEAALDISQAEDHFTELALASTKWTIKTLADSCRKYLTRRPLKHEEFDVMFVHSSPKEPFAWHYILSEIDAKENFRMFSTPICFFGHSHRAEIFCNTYEHIEPKSTQSYNDGSSELYLLDKTKRYLINPGSVGQPRDYNPRLSFGIFDTEEFTYENIRADYDIHSASQAILAAKLPQYNAQRLFLGK